MNFHPNFKFFILLILFAYSHEQNEVKLVIQGEENQYFINNDYYITPSEVLVNGNIIESCKKQKFCYLDNPLNNITIRFDTPIESCENMFKGLANIIEIDLSNLDTSRDTSLASMFEGCINLNKINFGNINTSLINNMHYLFNNCIHLESIDLSNFNTSSTTTMEGMFLHCESLESVDLSKFDTSKVENFKEMFAYNYKMYSINVSNFDTSRAKNIRGMFYNCNNLKYVDLSNFNTALVTNFQFVIGKCSSLVYANFKKFIIKGGGNNLKYFLQTKTSGYIICIDDENTRKDLFNKFKYNIYNCSHECFDKNIKLDFENNKCIESCSESTNIFEYNNICFDKCPYKNYPILINDKYLCVEKIPEDGFYLDNDDNIYKQCYETCKNCYGKGNNNNNNCKECISDHFLLNEAKNKNCYPKSYYNYFFDEDNIYSKINLKINKIGYSDIYNPNFIYNPDIIIINGVIQNNITNNYYFNEPNNNIKLIWNNPINTSSFMFEKCLYISEINFSNFDTSLITSMNYMFHDCISLTLLDLTGFITSNVTSMEYMFSNCKNLISLNLSYFDTSKVININHMFFACSKIESLYLSNFDTSKAINIWSMFNGCSKLTTLDISNFNTSLVNNMASMFKLCSSLTFLNLSNFDTSHVGNMTAMFYECSKLTCLDLSNFNTSQVKNMQYMFYNCKELISLEISNFYTSKVTNMDHLFYGCSKLVSLDISNFVTSLVLNMSYMFYVCSSLESLNISNFDTTNVLDMKYMFYGCVKLKSLNLLNFDTSRVTDMSFMFQMGSNSLLADLKIDNFNTSKVLNMGWMFMWCNSLKKINISNFDTSLVTNMSSMFNRCYNLTSLYLWNFNTSNVITMISMFNGCISLISLNLSNFDTSKVTSMNSMFYNCGSLISLNLSNFDTTNVIDMQLKFTNCISLSSLNLSNFNTNNVIYLNKMFEGCINLEYINMNNFNKNDLLNCNDIFKNTPDNIVICINETKNIKIFNELMKKNCYNIDCSYDWKLSQKKIYNHNDSCINNCYDDINYKYEDNGKCFDNCLYGVSSSNTCKCKLDMCLTCSPVSLNKNLCTKCNIGYYQKENDLKNIGNYISCYKESKGFYLDKMNDIYIFKKCYYTCETCKIKGDDINHNCLTCKSNYTFEIINNNNYINCFHKCDYYYYFDINHNYNCTLTDSCPKEYNKLKNITGECLKSCIYDKEYKYEFRNICYKECPDNTVILNKSSYYCEIICDEDKPFEMVESQICLKKCSINEIILNKCKLKYNNQLIIANQTNRVEDIKKEEIKKKNIILENTEEDFMSNEFNKSNIENGGDVIIQDDKMIITFTTTANQKNGINNNKTNVILGECEALIRKEYKIPNDNFIYMRKIDVYNEGLNIPKIEYDIYCYINKTITKLNLSVCNNVKIEFEIPLIIPKNTNYDKFDLNSGYYKDKCYIVTTEIGTEVPYSIRNEEYKNGNNIICQDDCSFSDYNYEIKKVKCLCKPKQASSSFEYMNINKTKLFENLVNIKNIANFDILICYNLLFSKNGIKHNIGFFIILTIIIIYLFLVVIYYSKKQILNDKINEIALGIKNWDLVLKDKNEKSNQYIKKIKSTFVKNNAFEKNIITRKSENIQIMEVNKTFPQISLINGNNDKFSKETKGNNPPIKTRVIKNKNINININKINGFEKKTESKTNFESFNLANYQTEKNKLIEKIK